MARPRTRWLLGVLGAWLAGCSAAPRSESATPPHPTVAPTGSSAASAPPSPAPVSTAASAATATTAAPAVSPEVIDEDLSWIVGGRFHPDHLGPERYHAIVARYRQQPTGYVQRLLARYGPSKMAIGVQPDEAIVAFLEQLYPRAPREVERAARLFHTLYSRAPQAGLKERRVQRLLGSARRARVLAGGIDRPLDPAWPAATADTVTAVATPQGPGLLLQRACTCGERFACRVAVRGSVLTVRFRSDPSEPPLCDDCYPGWTTCTVPRLPPDQRLDVEIEGQRVGTMRTTAAGRLPMGPVPLTNRASR